MRAPDAETVIRIYGLTEIGTKEIKELFGCGDAKACEKKREAKKLMAEEKVRCFVSTNVNTKVAFRAWGIDFGEYEERYRYMKKFNLLKQA